MSWTPVGFGKRNGNEPTGSQFIVHGGIELELFDANTLACSGAYLVSIQIGSLLVISPHLQLAVHWCGGTGKERKDPRYLPKARWCLVLPIAHRDYFIIKGTYRSE